MSFGGLRSWCRPSKSNLQLYFRSLSHAAADVVPNDQLSAKFLEQHVSTATWTSYVVECREDYDLLYREVREKLKVPINIVQVDPKKNGVAPRRVYSDEKFELLKNEHGFRGYMDEMITATPSVAQALMNRHNIHAVLVGGDAVQSSLDRKDLVNFLCTKEGGGTQNACFFYTSSGVPFRCMAKFSRYSGGVIEEYQQIPDARILKPGTDPSRRKELQDRIAQCEATIEELRPEVDEAQGRIDAMNKEGSVQSTRAREIKQDREYIRKFKKRVQNAQDKLEEAEENVSVTI